MTKKYRHFQACKDFPLIQLSNYRDADFAAGYAEGKVLFSKRENAEYYSNHMAEKAGSTVAIDKNFDAIQSHLSGMTIADAEALAGQENAADAVSGATLADTAGYVGAVVAAAKK